VAPFTPAGPILEACGNARLIEQINRNNDYYFNVRIASLYTDEELATSARQHAALADVIVRRDGDGAEQVMRAHIREALTSSRSTRTSTALSCRRQCAQAGHE
jgi:DNA-binding GntR family transcriptional regulator